MNFVLKVNELSNKINRKYNFIFTSTLQFNCRRKMKDVIFFDGQGDDMVKLLS